MAGLLRRLQAKRPQSKKVRCETWECDVTLHRPHALAKVRAIEIYNAAEKNGDGQIVDKADQYAFAVELLSGMICDDELVLEFDSVEGRSYLSCEEGAIAELIDDAMTLAGFTETADDELEDAKKNST